MKSGCTLYLYPLRVSGLSLIQTAVQLLLVTAAWGEGGCNAVY